MRAIGVALDKNTLQQVAYANGINMSVDAMTRAQKTELIYYQIMMSTQRMQGMLAKSTISPQVAIMQLKNEFLQLARAIGSVFIPIAMKIIPVVRAITQILTEAAQWLAGLFGFKLGDYTVNVQDMGASIGGIADNLDDVGGSARKATRELQKMLMPFDELNNVNFETGSSGGSGGGSGIGGVGGSLGLPLPEYDMFAGLDSSINDKVENIKNKFKEFLPILKEIATLMAAIWAVKKIGNFISSLGSVMGVLGGAATKGAGVGSYIGGTGLLGAITTLALAVADIQMVLDMGTWTASGWNDELQKYLERTGKRQEELAPADYLNISMNAMGHGYIQQRFGEDYREEFEQGNKAPAQVVSDIFNKNKGWENQPWLLRLGLAPASFGYDKYNEYYERTQQKGILSTLGKMAFDISPLGIGKGFYNKVGSGLDWFFGKDISGQQFKEKYANQEYIEVTQEEWDAMQAKKIENQTKALNQLIASGSPIGKGIDSFIKKIEGLGNAFKDLPTTIKGAVDKIKEKVPKIFTGIKDKILPTVTTIKDNVVSKFGLLKDGVISKIKSTDSEGTSVFSTIKNSLTGKSEETKNSVVSKFEETKNGILSKLGLTKTEGSTALEEAKNLFMAKASETKDGTVNAYKLLKDNSVKELIKLRDDGSITAEEFRAKLKAKMEAIPNENLSPLDKLKRGVLSTLSDTSSGAGSKMDEIKRKLNFSGFHWQLPSLKLPHFSWSSITNTVSSGIKGILSKLSLPISLPKLNVSWWAEGGFPNAGELFIANEAGPELIGNIGRRTAVANQNQITEGIANATYNAFTRALQENGGGNNGDNYFEVNVGDERIYSGYATRRDRDSKRYGVQT